MMDPKKRLRFYNWFFLPMTALLLALTVNLGFKYYQLRSAPAKSIASIKIEPTQKRARKTYDISNNLLMDSILSIVQSYYVDSKRVENSGLLSVAVESMNTIPGVKAGEAPGNVWIETTSGRKDFAVSNPPTYQEIIDTLTSISSELSNHVSSTQDQENSSGLQQASVDVLNSVLTQLDAHSALLSPESYKELRQGTEGSFGGLGVLVGIRDNLLTVIKPLPRSPAQRAGIMRYDRILGIDGKSTYGHTLDELVEYMRGEPGTAVKLSLLRDGAEAPSEMSMEREVIQVDSVTAHKVEAPPGAKILRLVIESFSSRTSREVLAGIKKFRAENNGKMHGLILDLRANPGGLLDQAVQVADLFLQKGVIVSTKGRREEVESAGSGFDEVGFPLAVLIDSDSASASEIVAGALQDHGRAVIIGQPSFGKGSVQTIFELPGERALKLTIARYYTPSGRSIQNTGIIPDVWLQPVFQSDHNENLLGSFRYRNERFLRNHLESSVSGTDYAAPKFAMKAYYLSSNRIETEFDERKEDRELEIATDLLYKVHKSYGDQVIPGTIRSSHWLGLAGPTLLGKINSWDSKTSEWLQKAHGLNWNEKPVESDATAKLEILIDSPQYQEVHPGDTINLKYTVKNAGPASAPRLSVFVRSETAALDTREYLIGSVHAGDLLNGTLAFQLPKSVEQGPIQLRVGVGADGWPSPDAVSDYWIEVKTKPFTEIEAQVDLVEESGGKIDGVLECRETAKLQVTFYNRGASAVANLAVSVMNLAGKQVSLKDAIKKVEEIGPGETKIISFDLKAAKDVHTAEVGFGVFADSDELKVPFKQRYQIKSLPVGAITKASNAVSH